MGRGDARRFPLPSDVCAAPGVRAAPGSGRSPVVGIVPTEQVVLREVDLPKVRWAGRLYRLVPNALEEQLVDDVDELEFAVGKQTRMGRVPVLAIRRADIARWSAQAAVIGEELTALVPDVYCVPEPVDGWGLAMDGDRAVVRTGRHTGFAVEADSLALYLERHAVSSAGQRPTLWTHGSLPGPLETQLRASGWRIEQLQSSPFTETDVLHAGSAAGVLALAVSRGGSGDAQAGKGLCGNFWAFALAAATIALAVDAGLTASRLSRLEEREGELRSLAESQVRAAFPETGRLVAIEAQTAQALAKLRDSGRRDGNRLLSHLDAVAAALVSAEGARLEAFRFAGDAMHLSLAARQAADVNHIRQVLERAGFDAAVLSIAAADGGVRGELRLHEVLK